MTNSKNLFATILILLSGGYLILSIPAWLSYSILGAVTLSLLVHTAHAHKPVLKATLNFIKEFFAFGLMLTVLIATAVLTHNVLNVL